MTDTNPPVGATVVDAEPIRYEQIPNGCWAACLAGLLRVPHEVFACLVPQVPESDVWAFRRAWEQYEKQVRMVLAAHGFAFFTITSDGAAPPGFAIASGPSVRLGEGHDHVVMVRDGEIWHDPHPSKDGIRAITHYDVLVPLDPSALWRMQQRAEQAEAELAKHRALAVEAKEMVDDGTPSQAGLLRYETGDLHRFIEHLAALATPNQEPTP